MKDRQTAAVIGWPISHSLSPGIYSFLAHQLKMPAFHYEALEVAPERLASFIENWKSQKGQDRIGINVTIPHKESILKFLDHPSPEVQVVGAANVVHRQGARLCGYNTDVHGILKTWDDHACPLEGKRALVLGAGGAALATVYALVCKRAGQVDVLNINFPRARALVDKFTAIFPQTRFRAISSADLTGELSRPGQPIAMLINSTPLGMAGKPCTPDGREARAYFAELFDLLQNFLSPATTAFDLIYRPERTPFLQLAEERGLRTLGGLQMLVEQALQTWRIWFPHHPGTEDLAKLQPSLMEYLRHRPVYLTGLMGAGKSTVGQALAERLQWRFLDMDQLIGKEMGMAIPEIFQRKGEAAFREVEAQLIQQNAFTPRSVIALGGGALGRQETRELLGKSGRLVYLKAQTETLLQRLKSTDPGSRPLLQKAFAGEVEGGPISLLKSLLLQREPHYLAAPIQVQTDDLTPEQVAREIAERL